MWSKFFFTFFAERMKKRCNFAASKIPNINNPENRNITALHPRELAIMAFSNLRLEVLTAGKARRFSVA